jgi:hypothetical protein
VQEVSEVAFRPQSHLQEKGRLAQPSLFLIMETTQIQLYRDHGPYDETVEDKLDRLQRLADHYATELYRLNGRFSELTLLYARLLYAAKVARGYLPAPIDNIAKENGETRTTGLDAFLHYHASKEERVNRKRHEEQQP